MIEISGLMVRYGEDDALRGVDLTLAKDRTCAVIGPSGCGKTTLLYVLAGLIGPGWQGGLCSGTVHILGRTPSGIRPATAIVFQDYGLFPWKTAAENIALGLRVRRRPPAEIAVKTGQILQELGLEAHRNKYPGALSGGEQQRTALGRALVTDPDLLLLDEPSAALDAMTREEIQGLLLSLWQKKPRTMVLVTHSIEEAVYLGQTIVVMKKASVGAVLDNPCFGMPDSLNQPDFYGMCLRVRKTLEQVNPS
jgi:NitT/TauT family transport system ATP-binding protein